MEKLGILNDSISIITYDEEPSKEALLYQAGSSKTVLLIKDTRSVAHRSYIPSLKPYGMKMFMKDHAHLIKGHNLFYHDSDVMFTKPFNWDDLVKDTRKCYMSDTVSYIGAQYIISKDSVLLDKMCDIVYIDPQQVIDNIPNSGGGQYIFGKDMKMSYAMWNKIEDDSVRLYNYMAGDGTVYKQPNDPYPIQAWTAEMWSQLWNTWLYGYQSEVIKEMDFSWPMNPISEIFNKAIYHNAGVTDRNSGLFYKGEYINKSPFSEDLSWVDKTKSSRAYAELIMECSKTLI
jgi:hypothetical protein